MSGAGGKPREATSARVHVRACRYVWRVCQQMTKVCVSRRFGTRVRLGDCVHVCEPTPHCAGLQRPKRLLLPLGGSGLKIMWCAMSGGEQGADSKEPERHTHTHTRCHTPTHTLSHGSDAIWIFFFFLFYGYLTHRLNILIKVSIHKQK